MMPDSLIHVMALAAVKRVEESSDTRCSNKNRCGDVEGKKKSRVLTGVTAVRPPAESPSFAGAAAASAFAASYSAGCALYHAFESAALTKVVEP